MKKTYTIEELIGCNTENLKQHLENQFKSNMSWKNYGLGGWEIDHIKPLASAKTKEELYNLFHYTNLQPLWASENRSKGCKIIGNR